MSQFYNVLGELLNKVKPHPDNDAITDNNNEEKEWVQEIDREVMKEKAKIANMFNEFHQKVPKIEMGDKNEAAGQKMLMKCIYGLSQTVEPHNIVIVDDGQDDDVVEHEVEHGIALKGNKKMPISTAIGSFLEGLFKNSDCPFTIPDAPHLIGGVVMLPPPPAHAGVLDSEIKGIVEDMNRKIST